MKGRKHAASLVLRTVLAAASALLGLGATPANAAANFTSGHINNVTFIGDAVLIMVDGGLPDNCIGTSWGWIKVPVANKNMSAFVIGLWMRGDAGSTVVTVYTDGLVDGYCRITQIDPAG